MGEVYEGLDETLRRKVAVKAVRAEYRLHSRAKRRFLAEARTLSLIDHPNICRVHEFIEGDECDFLVLELVEGRSLREVIADGLDRSRALGYARQVLDVLAAVHEKGVIHRDLKPDNVMITADDQVKVLDFGLARSEVDDHEGVAFDPSEVVSEGGHSTVIRTRVGTVVGTVGYMSPEQARGDPITAATDIYSAGLMMHEMLTGRHPYPTDLSAPALVRMAALGESLRVTGLPHDLEALIESMKSPLPEARPTAAEAVRAIEAFTEGPKRRRRRRIALAVAALFVVTAAVPVGMWFHERSRSAKQASLVQRFTAEARDLEWLMRVEHMMPVHDIRPAEREVRQRIDALEKEMERIGSVANGPGRFALGRGLLALGDYSEACGRLQRAWDDGYRTPELASALGTALSGLYRDELELAGRIPDRQQRLARKEEVARTLGRRAREFQTLGRGARLLPPDYVAALISFDEEHYEDAISHATAARTAVPWLYDASLISARAEVEIGERNDQHGETGPALESYQRALTTLGNTAEVAPSDARVYALEAGVWNAIAMMRLYGRQGDPVDAADRALGACDVADTVDADSLAAVTARSTAHLIRAVWLARTGASNEDDLRLAEESAQRAVELEPTSSVAHFNLGFVRENTGDLEGAADAYRTAAGLDPTSARIHNNLGHVYHMLRRFDDAIEQFESAIDLDPDLTVAYTNLENDLLFYTGRIRDGVAVCRRQLARDDRSPWGHVKLAQALMFIDTLDSARHEAERANELDPDNLEVLWTLATIDRLRGADDSAAAIMERYRALFPSDPWGIYLTAVLDARRGRTESARREFGRFVDGARAAIRDDPTAAEPRYRLALGLARLGAADDALAEGRRAFDRCVSADGSCHHELARVLAVCGRSDEAFVELRRALGAGYRNVIWTWGSQDFESLVDDPRFEALLEPYRHG
jgi:tetratricopeptide (TPR) repeat protein